jgi:hypothetical protein
MGLLSHGLAFALGYAMAQPQSRARLAQAGRQAADLAQRPEVVRLREQGRQLAVEQAQSIKQKVAYRTSHFPPSPNSAPSSALGGTTVMEDSEAAVLGTPVVRPPEATPPSTPVR